MTDLARRSTPRGSTGVATLTPRAVSDAHRDAVADALRAAGLVVRAEVGLSDFRVDLAVAADGGGPWVAVLLDGPGWAGRATVADRESLPTAVLEGTMGWRRVERVWLPSWLTERDRVVRRLVDAALGVRAAARTPGDVPAGVQDEGAQDAGVQDAGVQDHPAPLARAAFPPPPPPPPPPATPGSSADGAHGEDAARPAVFVAASTSGWEGRLARVVGNRFGLQRVVAKRSAEILRVVPRQLRRTSPLGSFYWAQGSSPEAHAGFRTTPPGVVRPLAEVAPEEIANAMAHLARLGHGIAREELLRETAGAFGLGRLTGTARDRLDAVLAWAVSVGRLELDDERVVSP